MSAKSTVFVAQSDWQFHAYNGTVKFADNPFPGTPYFEQLANDYDFYDDALAQIEAVAVENDRMPKTF